tara:strand:- start:358 stop:747 length:390 start_codon:yes stop_codon:yes gene_type:complete
MTTSLNTTKKEKVVSKKSEVTPSNYHLEEKQYAPMVIINGETTFGAWCDTKEEARARLNHLEIALDYHNYPTKEEESIGKDGVRAMTERVRIMNKRYEDSGRSDPNHPLHSIYTGLAEEYEQVFSNNSK